MVGGAGEQGAGVLVAGGKNNLLTVEAGGYVGATSGTAAPTDLGTPEAAAIASGAIDLERLQAMLSRDLAGVCTVVGVAGPASTMEQVPLGQLYDLGGSIRFSWYGDCLPTRDFPTLAAWYEQGRLNLDQVVSRKIALEDVNEAFEAMERGETLRSVIMFDGA